MINTLWVMGLQNPNEINKGAWGYLDMGRTIDRSCSYCMNDILIFLEINSTIKL